jgi:hypothetical protein
MARVQLIIPDQDRDRYAHRAREEGMSLSAWLRAAAEDRLRSRTERERFRSVEDLQAFFREVDQRGEAGSEPDWEQHLQVIRDSRRGGTSST